MITILHTFILSWLITHFSPLKMLAELLLSKKMNPMVSILISIMTLPIYCLMCCSFWTGLILSGNIYIASLTAFIGFWYDKILGPTENYEKLN